MLRLPVRIIWYGIRHNGSHIVTGYKTGTGYTAQNLVLVVTEIDSIATHVYQDIED